MWFIVCDLALPPIVFQGISKIRKMKLVQTNQREKLLDISTSYNSTVNYVFLLIEIVTVIVLYAVRLNGISKEAL